MSNKEQIRFEQIKMEAFVEAIQGALGTAETANALVEVARNAHRAEQELAALKIKYDELNEAYGQEMLLSANLAAEIKSYGA